MAPADLGNSAWSEIDALNNSASPNGWTTATMLPNQVEPTGRAMMGATKRWYDKINPIYTTGGTSTAYTVTSTVAEAAYYAGQIYTVIFNATCGASPTLTYDTLAAVPIRKFSNGAYTACALGDIKANQVVAMKYTAGSPGNFDIVSMSFSVTDFISLTANNTFTGTNTFNLALAFAAAAVIGTRSALSIDQRTAVADAAYTVTSTDYTVVYTSLTVARTVTLPAASTFNAGRRLVIMDGSGSASQIIGISIAPNGTDTIAGSNTTQVGVNIARGSCVLVCNGATGWDVEKWSVRYVNTLGADVAMNSTASYFDGPSVAQGTVGVWRAYGQIEINSVNGGSIIDLKLWDGTTVIASLQEPSSTSGTGQLGRALSGMFTAPAGNIRISARNESATSGSISFNKSGLGNDSTITVERIA